MFFKDLALINYKIGDEYKEMQNIVLSTNPVDDIYGDRYFDTMVIRDQTPEELADELYGDTQYYWILLYVNKIVNPFTDWVIPSEMLEEYVLSKYKDEIKDEEDLMIQPKHFQNIVTKEILVGVDHERLYKEWLDNDKVAPMGYNLITYYDYEQELNDKKRYIRYVPRGKLLSFVDRYETAIRGL